MTSIFLQRLGLFASLCAVILAALWNHVVPKLSIALTRLVKFLSRKLSLQGIQEDDEEADFFSTKALPLKQHPRSTGHSLGRSKDLKQVRQ